MTVHVPVRSNVSIVIPVPVASTVVSTHTPRQLAEPQGALEPPIRVNSAPILEGECIRKPFTKTFTSLERRPRKAASIVPTPPSTIYPRKVVVDNHLVTIFYSHKKPRAAKRGSGCWTCKLRKKTCPGNHPVCNSCVRLQLDCDYSVERPYYMDVPRARAQRLNEIKRFTDPQGRFPRS